MSVKLYLGIPNNFLISYASSPYIIWAIFFMSKHFLIVLCSNWMSTCYISRMYYICVSVNMKHYVSWSFSLKGRRRMCHFLKPLKLTQELSQKISYSSELWYGSCFYDVYEGTAIFFCHFCKGNFFEKK